MFKCRACEDKLTRIADLKEANADIVNSMRAHLADLSAEVARLHNIISPVRRAANDNDNLEANALLSGHSEQIEVTEVSPEVLAERESLLSGTY